MALLVSHFNYLHKIMCPLYGSFILLQLPSKFSTTDPALWNGGGLTDIQYMHADPLLDKLVFLLLDSKNELLKFPICTFFHGGLLFPSTNPKYCLSRIP